MARPSQLDCRSNGGRSYNTRNLTLEMDRQYNKSDRQYDNRKKEAEDDRGTKGRRSLKEGVP